MEQLAERLARVRNIIYLNAESGMTNDEIEQHAEDYEETDQELNKLQATKNSFTVNSIETRAYEHKIKDQVWQCVKIVNDNKQEALVWGSLEEIDAEVDRVLLYRVINECVSFWQGVPSDFLEEKLEIPDGENDIPSPKSQDSISSENQ
jgi:hypothetical protein